MPIEKVVETGVRQLVPPCSSFLDISAALADAVQSLMWAHSIHVSLQLPDSGSYNARRMVDELMPADNAL